MLLKVLVLVMISFKCVPRQISYEIGQNMSLFNK